jgi:hypothetical protein
MPHATQVVNRLGQGRDDTAYLRMPGIGSKSNFHRLVPIHECLTALLRVPSLKLEFDNNTGMISILYRNERKREGEDNGIQLF